jgi:ArsR family transcriptional regulator
MNHLSLLFKAFGNEERVRLMYCLNKEQCVSELQRKCSLSQSALSQHLRVLRQAGLVKCSRKGKKQLYIVANKKVLGLAQSLLTLTK